MNEVERLALMRAIINHPSLLTELRLSAAEIRVVKVIRDNPGATVRDISDLTLDDDVWTKQLVIRLYRRGWLTREPVKRRRFNRMYKCYAYKAI